MVNPQTNTRKRHHSDRRDDSRERRKHDSRHRDHSRDDYDRKEESRSDSQRSRRESSPCVPSMVIFISGLKSDVMEADFHDALSKFGNIAYVLCMGDKALVEFETMRSAKDCVALANTVRIAGRSVKIEFSRSASIRRSGLESQYASNILIISIFRAKYEINVDVIYQPCCTTPFYQEEISHMHGRILRIALLKGTNGSDVQALVEFDSVVAAKNAKHSLNGADIYSGCCTLKVEFSKVKTISVSQNSREQWDFTLDGPSAMSTVADNYGYDPSKSYDSFANTTPYRDNCYGNQPPTTTYIAHGSQPFRGSLAAYDSGRPFQSLAQSYNSSRSTFHDTTSSYSNESRPLRDLKFSSSANNRPIRDSAASYGNSRPLRDITFSFPSNNRPFQNSSSESSTFQRFAQPKNPRLFDTSAIMNDKSGNFQEMKVFKVENFK